ncbi:hypothetical protein WJX82_004326 [Trebouxia sp. C0006]
MATEDDVLRQVQQQISALQASKQQQQERDTARAQAEVALRRKAAETTKGEWQQVLTAEGEVFLDRDGERFKIILEYLRAARDQQAFLVPTNLEGWELANLDAEAQYYGLAALHAILQAAATATKSHAYQYKHMICYQRKGELNKESELQALYDKGWDLRQSSVAGMSSGGDVVVFLVLRHLR